MGRIETSRSIRAPVDRVFATIAHIDNYRHAVPDIVRVEFVSEQHQGAGTRFRETRRMGRREATVELEVREYATNDHVRIVSDAGGTIWDTTFRVRAADDGTTTLSMVMEDKPYKLVAKVATPLIRPMVRRAVDKDLDAVKTYLERS